jgi:hypothetical protein
MSISLSERLNVYECETWSVTLREDRRHRMFDEVFRRTRVPKREAVKGS